MTVMALPIRRPRRNARVPLRVGDVWVRIGPATEFTITAMAPRPTFQKPYSQAVTLSDGRTITEATLRAGNQRKQEYMAYMPVLRAKWEAAKREFFGQSAEVIQFRRPPA